MDLNELKNEFVREQLGINNSYGRVLSFIDFANVNNWFEDDRQDHKDKQLASDEKLGIELKKLYDFAKVFSQDVRFYYGHDPSNRKSLSFLYATRKVFGKPRTFTKEIQKVRHYLHAEKDSQTSRTILNDKNGSFVFLPKCNFDVEIAVDAVKLLDTYDTFCIFSGDADFAYLHTLLREKGKKVILIKGGHITSTLKKSAHLVINAQKIKQYISEVKQKPGTGPGFADR